MKPARDAPLEVGLRAVTRAASVLLLTVVVALSLAACPSENQNPERLWLSLDGVETRVRLIPAEPEPF